MYRRRSIKQIQGANVPILPVSEFECDHSYHPLSYYLYGGSDPNGEHLNLDRPTISDTPDDLASGCKVDAMCDPRTNYLDLVEQVGVKNAEKAVSSAQSGKTEEQ